MENEIYQILKKHKLPLKKREEVLSDLLLLFSVGWRSEQLCGDLHSTDWNGKCFNCGEQVFVREPK